MYARLRIPWPAILSLASILAKRLGTLVVERNMVRANLALERSAHGVGHQFCGGAHGLHKIPFVCVCVCALAIVLGAYCSASKEADELSRGVAQLQTAIIIGPMREHNGF